MENAVQNVVDKTERIIKWMTMSGLKINENKTEVCIFHRCTEISIEIIINNANIKTSNTINILGIQFDLNGTCNTPKQSKKQTIND